MNRKMLLPLAAPLLIAAFAPEQQGLSTPTLLLVSVAIVGVVVLRGVLLRRHLRKRPRRRPSDHTAVSTTDAGNGQHANTSDCNDNGGGDGGSSCD